MWQSIDPLSPWNIWVRISCCNLRLSCVATSNLTQMPLYVIKIFSFCLCHDVKKLRSIGLRHVYMMQFWPMELGEKSWEMDLGKIFLPNKKSHPRDNAFFNHMLLHLCMSCNFWAILQRTSVTWRRWIMTKGWSCTLLNHWAIPATLAFGIYFGSGWYFSLLKPLLFL